MNRDDLNTAIDLLQNQLEKAVEVRDEAQKDLDECNGLVTYLRNSLMNVRQMRDEVIQ